MPFRQTILYIIRHQHHETLDKENQENSIRVSHPHRHHCVHLPPSLKLSTMPDHWPPPLNSGTTFLVPPFRHFHNKASENLSVPAYISTTEEPQDRLSDLAATMSKALCQAKILLFQHSWGHVLSAPCSPYFSYGNGPSPDVHVSLLSSCCQRGTGDSREDGLLVAASEG
ncbi:hypothetical protein CEXT_178631, partial [Caerostris extrusa]